MAPAPTPTFIIAGYLGAGKTTLINACLRTRAGKRIAVLVNDFGDISIDASLIESQSDTVFNLAGGCICCSIGSSLLESLTQLASRPERFDYLLVETSGVALPKPVAQSLSLVPQFVLAGIVVLAAAQRIQAQLRDQYVHDTIAMQLGQAHHIVLAVRESVLDYSGNGSPDPAQAVALELAQRFCSPQFVVPPALNMQETSTENALASARPAPTLARQADYHLAWLLALPMVKPDVPFSSRAWHLSATQTFEHLSLEDQAPLDLAKLTQGLLHLQAQNPQGLVRAKGGVICIASGKRHLLQMAGAGELSLSATDLDLNGVVFLALKGHLDQDAIMAVLQTAQTNSI